MAKVQLVNESSEPLANVPVVAFPIGKPTTISQVATTDKSGVASFPNLDAGSYGFKPRITRYGTGQSKLTVLSDTPEERPQPQEPKKAKFKSSKDGTTDGGGQDGADGGNNWWTFVPDLPTSDPGGGLVWLDG